MTLETRRLPQISLLKVPRQARAVETVHAVLDAALRVLSREGAAAFNTNRIAEVAGISPGSLYQYFANRDMILAAVVERSVLHAETVVREVLRSRRELPVADALRTAIDELTGEMERNSTTLAEILNLAPLLAQNGMMAVLETRLMDVIREYLACDPARFRVADGSVGLFVGVNGCIFVLLKWAAERPAHISRAALVDAILEVVQGIVEDATVRAPARLPPLPAVPVIQPPAVAAVG